MPQKPSCSTTVNYDPNGKASIVTNTITQNNRFPGQYADATGFNHNGFRDYNPTAASGRAKVSRSRSDRMGWRDESVHLRAEQSVQVCGPERHMRAL